MIDLVNFADHYISLSSIYAVRDEIEDGQKTGVVFIEYGPHGACAGFEGTAADVMRVIAEWQLKASGSAAARPMAQPALVSA